MASQAEKLLTERQAAEILAVSPTTLATWRCRKRYVLPFIRIGGARAIRYAESDVLAFIAASRVGGETAEART
ncbi:MAG: helix-turn-helix transcriptional regulator [Thermoanaerobaculales bacterium]